MQALKGLLRRRRDSISGAYLPPETLDNASNTANPGGTRANFMEEIPDLFLLHAPDRGKWSQEQEKERAKKATLVEGGRKAGKSRVVYYSPNLKLLLFTRDFFISAINQKTHIILSVVFMLYVFLSFFWSIPYYLIMRFYPGCIYGATHYVEIWIFSFITMATIGYGNTGPQQCWAASVVISIQGIFSMLLEAVVIGIIFARISHPKQRGRSIFISDSAVISRRDGILKFMFRVADVRKTQVVDPKIKAYLYTWGDGRITAEGERVPVRCEALEIGYIDGMLILPLTIEHTIDELSPLCGHTHDSLEQMSAELVVTFEGTTEFGNPFMARRSFVPTDIFWGHQFVDIIVRPSPGETRYIIDLDRFHDIVPQPELPPLPSSALSRLIINRAKRTVPYPLLGDNTMVVSDTMCLYEDGLGRLCLSARVADTYPNQIIEITGKMHLYRWTAPGSDPSFECFQLDCGYKNGADRLYLRLPMELTHIIDESSPLASWLEGEDGRLPDSDSEIVVMLTGYMYTNGCNMMRQRTYTVLNHVKPGCRFVPIVKHPDTQADRKPVVRWARFHDVAPTDPKARELRSAMTRRYTSADAASPLHGDLPSGSDSMTAGSNASTAAGRFGVSVSRNSHGIAMSPLDPRNDFTVSPIDLARYAAMVTSAGDNSVTNMGGAGNQFPPIPDFQSIMDNARDDPETRRTLRMLPSIARYTLSTTDALESLPYPGTRHGSLPGPMHFRASIAEEESESEDDVEDVMGDPLARFELGPQVERSLRDTDDGIPVDSEEAVELQMERSEAEVTSNPGEESGEDGRAPLSADMEGDGRDSPSSPLLHEEVSFSEDPAEPEAAEAARKDSETMPPSAFAGVLRAQQPITGAEESDAGPIHFNTPSSWSQTRALTNLFADPDALPAQDKDRDRDSPPPPSSP